MQRFETVQEYLAGHDEWRPLLERLRAVLNETELGETVKWGHPCYTTGGKNVAGLGAFKEFVSVWFFQGALSPGKRREYAEYIAEARREDTRNKRLEKIMPMILAGQGLNDRYRK